MTASMRDDRFPPHPVNHHIVNDVCVTCAAETRRAKVLTGASIGVLVVAAVVGPLTTGDFIPFAP